MSSHVVVTQDDGAVKEKVLSSVVQSLGTVTTTQTVDFSQGAYVRMTLGASITINLIASPDLVDGAIYYIKLIQDGTGSRLVTWNSIFQWPAGTAPTLTTTASHSDTFRFIYDAAAGKLQGSTVALNYAS